MLIGGAVIGLYAIGRARHEDRSGLCLVLIAVCGALVIAPNWIRNFLFYGDPVSPLIERFVAYPDHSGGCIRR